MGRIEFIYYANVDSLKGVGVPAKIDTGADTTSIHALNISIQSSNPNLPIYKAKPYLKASQKALAIQIVNGG